MAESKPKRVIRNARRSLIADFAEARATSEDRAIEYVPDNAVESRMFERLRHQGVVAETADGRFWYDKAMHAHVTGRNRTRTTTTVAAAGVGALAMGAFLLWRRAKRGTDTK